jgi:hypothetical protein
MGFLKDLLALLISLPLLCCCTAMAVPIVATGVYQDAVMAIDRNLLLPENVEVVIPYERHPEGFFLSPDGQRAIFTGQRSGVLLDLTDGQEVSLGSDIYVGRPIWLENDLFLAELWGASEPMIVNADDLSRTELERLTFWWEEEIGKVQAVLKASDTVYKIVNEWGSGDLDIVALASDFRSRGQSYLIDCPGSRGEQLNKLLKDIAYVTRRRQDTINCTFQGSIYSPDESLYVTGSSKTLTIYSKDGELVTQFRKHDYDGVHFCFIVIGWAHDSSGVFFKIRSSAAYSEQRSPAVLKLLARPARSKPMRYWPFLFLLIALVAVGGGGYLVKRKRHKKAAMAVLTGGVLLLLPWADWIVRYTVNQTHYKRAVRQAEKVNEAITFVEITDRLIPDPDDPEHKLLEVRLTVEVQEEADYGFYARLSLPLERRTQQWEAAGYELDIMKRRGYKRVHLDGGKQQINFIFPYWQRWEGEGQQRKPNIVSDGPYVFYVSLDEISSIGGMPFHSSQKYYTRDYNLLRPGTLEAEFQTSAYSLSDFECLDSLCGNE